MKIQANAYLRVSSKGQTKGHGFDRQQDAIRSFAKDNGYDVVGVFTEAMTGTEADRPVFTDMVAGMIANGVKTIIVESLDRLARDLTVQNALLAKLAESGLTLIAANTGDDVTAAISTDPMREAMILVQGVFAQLDKRLLVRKLAKTRQAKREATGRCEGRKAVRTLPR